MPSSCDDRLTEGNRTIIGWQPQVSERKKSPFGQLLQRPFEHDAIHEYSAGQRDMPVAGALCGNVGEFDYNAHNCLMEALRYLRAGPASTHILEHTEQHGSRVDDEDSVFGGQRKLVSAERRSVGAGFKFDSRLSLVRGVVTHARDGRHRIEQAAHARSERRVDALIYHFQQKLLFVFEQARS